jgi:hypothetical protein
MKPEFRPTGVEEVETETMRRLKESRAQHYLRGPIWMDDIRTAIKLGGSCLALLLLIHFRRAVTNQDEVTLPNSSLSELGIERDAKRRGLERLEKAKLITVERTSGHSVMIKLRSVRKREAPAPRVRGKSNRRVH